MQTTMYVFLCGGFTTISAAGDPDPDPDLDPDPDPTADAIASFLQKKKGNLSVSTLIDIKMGWAGLEVYYVADSDRPTDLLK